MGPTERADQQYIEDQVLYNWIDRQLVRRWPKLTWQEELAAAEIAAYADAHGL